MSIATSVPTDDQNSNIHSIGSAYSSNEASVLVPKLLAQYKSLIEKIYANGGRKFLLLNVPPTSRSPLLLDQGTDAVKAHAKWLASYNEGLQKMVDDFKANNSGVRVYLYPGGLCEIANLT